MPDLIKLLDVVALVADLPDQDSVRGQVGTVVEVLAPGVYEVEFCEAATGRTYAITALPADQLLRLQYAPVKAA